MIILQEIQVKSIVRKHWSDGRRKIATIICEELKWCGLNGRLKVIACLEALRRMGEWVIKVATEEVLWLISGIKTSSSRGC